ncbi:glycosyltransferase family 2 protein [Flavobacterium commune]|uniref:Glycosyl transferase family 2 n=1 Tax=Flavobacterium commune TaxID=1306519 RepID=A0A1D9P877_9FLAO|nr:galactosyltransferase-related protein [Flavobacterium commune]AOZ98504.1 hypothetical protein BIW12_03130 [Flavobacterium commune]
MITLVLTNRNRDLRIVKNCLESLRNQTTKEFELFFVDYGSDLDYLVGLKNLVVSYPKVHLILCPVNGQLWNKSRAINIALKLTNTPYFLVGDLDLIFAPQFMSTAYKLINSKDIYYFKYGFLSREESLKNKVYEEYEIDFDGNIDVAGTTLFPTEQLKDINGYDEFYHGWGAEDVDIHIRMSNLGCRVVFYDSSILVKHQWHPKQYRSKISKHPFHIGLEAINHAYMDLGKKTKRIIVNQNQSWGKMTDIEMYEKLKLGIPTVDLFLTNSLTVISAVLAQFANFNKEVLNLRIDEVDKLTIYKNQIKKKLNKKAINYIEMEQVNALILEQIIKNYRNNPYKYIFDRDLKYIQLKMVF